MLRRHYQVPLQQPEVNATKKAILIGHSEGTNFPPRIAADNPDKVRNIVLMAPVAEKWTDIIYFQEVAKPILYAENVLGKDHPGQLSVAEASKDPIFQKLVGGNLTQLLLNPTNVTDNNLTGILPEQKNNTNDDLISIAGVLKPALVRGFENDTSINVSQLSEKCISLYGCPSLGKSFSALPSVIGMIGNVSSNIGVLTLEGQNECGLRRGARRSRRGGAPGARAEEPCSTSSRWRPSMRPRHQSASAARPTRAPSTSR